MVVVNIPHGVFKDDGIAIAQFVVFVYQCLLGLFVTLGRELLGLEDVAQFAGFVDFSEGTFLDQRALYLARLQFLVAFEDDVAHLHLRLFVDAEVQYHLVLARHVVALGDVDDGIVVSFLVEILLGQNLGAVQHVRCNLRTLHDAQACLHVFTFRFLQTVEVDGRSTRPCGQVDAQVYLRPHDGVGRDGYFREEAVLPIALDGFGDFRARHFDSLSHGQS